MPVYFDRESTKPGRVGGASDASVCEADALTVGLVNNMPDPALQGTERQFVALLGAAADGLAVRLLPYALPEVPRTDWGRDYVSRFYSPIDDLWDSDVDAIIVTGTEPRSPDLRDEPYWGSLPRLLEWAGHHRHWAVGSVRGTPGARRHHGRMDPPPVGQPR